MREFANQRVLVVGLGSSGRAACNLLRRREANVVAVDHADTPHLRRGADELRAAGVEVRLGLERAPVEPFDLVVLSPGVPPQSAFVQELVRRNLPVIGELELGYQQSLCLNISITGTNGKTTTTELVERILKRSERNTVTAGNIGLPLCSVVEQTKDLDFLTLEVSSFQLESIQFFRPVVAVLLNLTPDHLDRYPTMADYARAKARLFLNQQAFDWAIVQTEALAQMRSLKLDIPSKLITFSANNRRADIYLDRGLLVSRLGDWAGPLFDMDKCQLRGPHNAENLMAALAVGHVLRVPLEQMAEALRTYAPAPHRCELVAGVKRAFLLGETREKIRAAWSLFTPCTPVASLLEAIQSSASNAVPGDIVLLSPACSSFDMFQNYQHRGEVFRQAVQQLVPKAGSDSSPREPVSRRDAGAAEAVKHGP